MTTSQKLFLEITTKYLHGGVYEKALSDAEFKAVFDEAYRHNLVHILGVVLKNVSKEQKAKLFDVSVQVLSHYELQEFFRTEIYKALENADIDYMPLKGSVLKDLYPEPWHRTCGDIDVLVRTDDIERAVEALKEEKGCKAVDKSEHDVVLIAPNGVVLELHYDLHEKEISSEEVWEDAKCEEQHPYKMSNEMFILCHIAHMAKHFIRSGCGLRPFVDLYFMREKMHFDEEKLLQMLDERKLKTFYSIVLGLIEAWFMDAELTDKLENISDFILSGGVFGTVENKVAIKRARMSGFKYFWKRAFVSCDALAYKYPILERYPELYLFCNIHRWYRLLFKGKFRKVKEELQVNAVLKGESSKKIEMLL